MLTEPGGFRFERFHLDPIDRRLRRDDIPVEINARYLDALALLVRDAGKLVSKERFLGEVWRGVPVTDEALTQCIRTLRRALGDDAAKPRFIETVPKHGYRFIMPVEDGSESVQADTTAGPPHVAKVTSPLDWRRFFLLGGAGTLGAGVAGVVGGLFYGFVGAAQPPGLDIGAPGMGAASVVLVLLWLTIAAAVMGGAGVSFGIAAAGIMPGRPWLSIIGGATGGMIMGGAVKLIGLDAFNLLLGRSPRDITGAAEGLVLGGAVGLGAWLASRGVTRRSLGGRIAVAALPGGVAGAFIPLLGGRMMGGSLDLLATSFPGSRLRLDQIGGPFGEDGFGPISQIVTGGLEGGLFSSCIVGAIIIARRSRNVDPSGDTEV